MNRIIALMLLGVCLAACTTELALNLPQVSPAPPTPSPSPSPSVPTVSTSFAGPALEASTSKQHLAISGLVPMGTAVVMKSTNHLLVISDLKLAKDRLGLPE